MKGEEKHLGKVCCSLSRYKTATGETSCVFSCFQNLPLMSGDQSSLLTPTLCSPLTWGHPGRLWLHLPSLFPDLQTPDFPLNHNEISEPPCMGLAPDTHLFPNLPESKLFSTSDCSFQQSSSLRPLSSLPACC